MIGRQNTSQSKFHRANRKQLVKNLAASKSKPELIIISGSSYVQASADRAYPFQQDSSFFYLTGIEEPGLLLVIDRAKEYIVTPDRSPGRKAFEGEIDIALISKISGIKDFIPESAAWPQILKSLNKQKKVALLQPAGNYISGMDMFINPSRKRLLRKLKASVKNLEITDVREIITKMRIIKDKYEIKMISQAIKYTEELFGLIDSQLKTLTTEHGLLAEVSHYVAKHQLQYSYDPIIASGINAVTLHYVKNNAKIDKKSLLLLDIGLKYKGYSADITRTVGDNPTKRQKQVYDSVLAVQNYAISILKPGQSIKQYEEKVTRFMGVQLIKLGLIKKASKQAIRQYFPHSTSHFLGIDVHDPGKYQANFETGMVLTVEPGIYIKKEKIGIRIEDDVLITNKSNKVLTSLPRNLGSLTIH